MTNMLFDAPYNKDERDVFTPRLKNFYFVIPTMQSDAETVAEEVDLFKQLQESMPQWAVMHIITREALYGANQPVFTEDYAVTYFAMDVDGNRIPVTTPLSEWNFWDITYSEVSA